MMEENNWDVALPIAILSLNTSLNKSIGYSPYELLFGKQYRNLEGEISENEISPYDIHFNLLNRQLREISADAITSQDLSQGNSKRYYDSRHRELTFEINDLVWAKTRGRKSKLADNFEGPYIVIERQGDIYKLRERSGDKLIVRHVSKLKRYSGDDTINYLVMSRAKQMSPLALIALAMVLTTNLATSQFIREFALTRAEMVSWVPTSHHVTEARKEYSITIYFKNPCEKLDKEFVEDQEMDYELRDSKRVCSENYHREITAKLEDLVIKISNLQPTTPRHKRSLFSFFGALFITNIIDTIFDDSAEKEELRQAQLNQLNKKMNFTTEAVIELSKQHQFLQQKVNELYTTTIEGSRRNIRLSVALSFVAAKISEKSSALRDFRFDLINSRTVNLKALSRLLDTDLFETVASESIRFQRFARNLKGGYVLSFFAQTFNPALSIYEVKTHTHWSRLTEKPVLLNYAGPSFVIYNSTNHCLIGINDLSRNSLATPCSQTNGRLGNLNIWTNGREGSPFDQPSPTSYIEILPDVSIYCFGRKIYIEDTEMECPPYAFTLRVSIAWKTADVVFNPYQLSNHTFEVAVQLPENVNPRIHLQERDEFIPTDTLKALYNMTARLEEERMKSFLVVTPVGGISYAAFNKILFSSIGTLTGITIWLWYHAHKIGRRRHHKIVSHVNSLLAPSQPEAIELPEHMVDEQVEPVAADTVMVEAPAVETKPHLYPEIKIILPDIPQHLKEGGC